MALMEPGDLFGEMPLFDEEPRSASARALERSEVVRVPFEAVRSELEAQPALLWDVVALLASRLRATDAALADAMFLDVTGRTAKRLLELSGDADEFVLPDHPGGAGGPGRRLARAGQQGDRGVRPPRMDRPDRPALPDLEPPAADRARPLTVHAPRWDRRRGARFYRHVLLNQGGRGCSSRPGGPGLP